MTNKTETIILKVLLVLLAIVALFWLFVGLPQVAGISTLAALGYSLVGLVVLGALTIAFRVVTDIVAGTVEHHL